MSDPLQIEHFPHAEFISTRWQDADINGQIASAAVYSFFDTVIQSYLVTHGEIDPQEGEVVAFVVSSSCDFYASAGFTDLLQVGIRAERIAGSTVEFEVALFDYAGKQLYALGRVVQVFIERATGTPATFPETLKMALLSLN